MRVLGPQGMPCPDPQGFGSLRLLIHPHLDLLENIPGCDYLSARSLPSSPLERPPGEAATVPGGLERQKGSGWWLEDHAHGS